MVVQSRDVPWRAAAVENAERKRSAWCRAKQQVSACSALSSARQHPTMATQLMRSTLSISLFCPSILSLPPLEHQAGFKCWNSLSCREESHSQSKAPARFTTQAPPRPTSVLMQTTTVNRALGPAMHPNQKHILIHACSMQC